MDIFSLPIIAIGVSINVLCFMFGMITGRHTAYKTIRTYNSRPSRGNVN